MNDHFPYDNDAMDINVSLRDEVQRLKLKVKDLTCENEALKAKLRSKPEGSGAPSPDALY